MKNTTPAVLVYFQDLLSGTDYMTDEEFGQYMRLLMKQNVVGHMSEEYLKRTHMDHIFPLVEEKFLRDEDGCIYNKRMEEEIQRRVNYSASRRRNRSGDKHMSEDISADISGHMETETETEINTNKKGLESAERKGKKRFIPPTVEEVMSYCMERGNCVNAERFVNYYTSNGWKVGKNSMKDWKAAVRTWEKRDKPKEKPRNEVLEMLERGMFDD